MNKLKLTKNLFISFAVIFPFISYGFSLTGSTFAGIIDEIIGIINILKPIFTAVAFIFFFWGLSKFILNSGSQAEIEKGRSYMLWGVLAIFILLTYSAIIGLIASDLDIGNGTTIPYINAGDSGENIGNGYIETPTTCPAPRVFDPITRSCK